ncbi:MAG: hypothetical protein EXR74_05245 [Bdellovibrionales bacterium]|nr:hypothetical protein [Bdellovibrionales bacterium]
MKYILSLFILAWVSLPSFSAPTSTGHELINQVQTYRFGACNWWSLSQGAGASGYSCTQYPQNITVPDARDVIRALEQAEQRISALEAKIGGLEAKLEKSE